MINRRLIGVVVGAVLSAVVPLRGYGQLPATPQTRLEPIASSQWRQVRLTAASTAIQQAAQNAVIVDLPNGRGTGGFRGSGVYLGDRYVATANHVIAEGARRGTVTFRDGAKIGFTTYKQDAIYDQALLQLDQEHPTLTGVEIYTGSIQPGMQVYSAGFGRGFRLFGGPVLGFASPTRGTNGWLLHRSPAISGDSGGPVFLSDGRLVGCLWGTNGSDTYAARPQRFRVLVQALFPRLAAWRAARGRGRDVFLLPEQPQQQPACGPDGCPIPQPEPDNGVVLNPPANGVPGPQGPKGDPGKTPTDRELRKLIEDVMSEDPESFRGRDGIDGRDGRGVDRIYAKTNGDLFVIYTDGSQNKIGNLFDLQPKQGNDNEQDSPAYFQIVPRK